MTDQKSKIFEDCRVIPAHQNPAQDSLVCQKIDSFYSLFLTESPFILFTVSARSRELKNRKELKKKHRKISQKQLLFFIFWWGQAPTRSGTMTIVIIIYIDTCSWHIEHEVADD